MSCDSCSGIVTHSSDCPRLARQLAAYESKMASMYDSEAALARARARVAEEARDCPPVPAMQSVIGLPYVPERKGGITPPCTVSGCRNLVYRSHKCREHQ